MDNITHSLVGITLGRAVSRKESNHDAAKAAIWTGVIGSNFPDIDFVSHFLHRGGEITRLAYLLFHRGLTHSILGSIPLGIGAAFLGARIVKRNCSWSLVFFGVFSVLIHIFSDYWNEYGVHPFSPLMNGWFYGDTIFILEPSLWLAMLPLALGGKLRNGLSTLWWIPLIGLLSVLWFGPYTSIGIAVGMTILFVVSFFFYKWTREPLVTLGLLSVLLLCFAFGSYRAREGVKEALHIQGASWNAVGNNLLVSPAPGNPFCWRVMASAQIQGYLVTAAGIWSQWPEVFNPDTCHFRGLLNPLNIFPPLQTSLLTSSKNLLWQYEFRGSLDEFKRFKKENTAFRRFLGFARFPFWKRDAERLIFGDLRFSRGSGRGFAEFEFPIRTTEGEDLPQWKGALDEVQ